MEARLDWEQGNLIYKDNYREITMLKTKLTSVVLGMAIAVGLVGCEGNNTTTKINTTPGVILTEVDKTIALETWTAGNYQELAGIGYSSLVENINLRLTLLGRERELAAFFAILLSLTGAEDSFDCTYGDFDVEQDNSFIKATFNSCQLGETLYEGELWSDLASTCDDTVVTESFIIGYKDYKQRQKIDGASSYSQMYANVEYAFVNRYDLATENITAELPCPSGDEIDSKVTMLPQTFIQLEDDGETQTTISNTSFEFQPTSQYYEYENLELIESAPASLTYSASGLLSSNRLGSSIQITATGFKYGQDGKTTEGSLTLTDGDREISMVFSTESVVITLDLDTTVDGNEASNTIAQEDF